MEQRLKKILRLFEEDRIEEAYEQLGDLHRRFPDNLVILAGMADCADILGDSQGSQDAWETLRQLEPDDPEAYLVLIGIHAKKSQAAHALTRCRKFLERWGDHPMATQVRTAAADYERQLSDMYQQMGLSMEPNFESASIAEEVSEAMHNGYLSQVKEKAKAVLKKQPRYVPAINNLSKAYALEGQIEKALATCQRSLELFPENVDALSIAVRYCLLLNWPEEADTYARRLKDVAFTPQNLAIKAESLNLSGDSQAVLDLLRQYRRSRAQLDPGDTAMLYHQAAVASCRQGKETQARELWNKALELCPDLILAEYNLAELDQPKGARNAPLPILACEWMPLPAIQEVEAIRSLMERMQLAWHDSLEDTETIDAEVDRLDLQISKSLRDLAESYPYILSMVPFMLANADPLLTILGFKLAVDRNTPEMLEALKEYALGRMGPDALRMEAMQTVVSAGLLPTGLHSIWQNGRQQDIFFSGYVISDEPRDPLTGEADRLLRQADIFISAGKSRPAETLLAKALTIVPGNPTVQYNLSVVYQLQKRNEEADQLIHEIHARYPDYLFARVSLAVKEINDGNVRQGEALLGPLLTKADVHFTEFNAIAGAMIQLHVKKHDLQGARKWLKAWQGMDFPKPAYKAHHDYVKGAAKWKRIIGNLKEGMRAAK